MKGAIGALLLLLMLLPSATIAAGMEEEITHLLSYIEQSGCLFIRNGQEHNSVDGLDHIRKKYDYVKKRVKRAEDFIEYAASKSSLSGKLYLVRCGEEEIPTADWLSAELSRFRQPDKEEKKMPTPDERSSP
jgi:hypothetical protein